MSSCADCAYWSEIERDCYGTRWGRCVTDRGKVFTLETELNDIVAENRAACLVFERRERDAGEEAASA